MSSVYDIQRPSSRSYELSHEKRKNEHGEISCSRFMKSPRSQIDTCRRTSLHRIMPDGEDARTSVSVAGAQHFALYLSVLEHCVHALPACAPTKSHHCGYLATTDRGVLLHAILTTLPHVEALPPTDEVPKVRADEDANDDVSVVVHGQQHDEVGNRKLQHVE